MTVSSIPLGQGPIGSSAIGGVVTSTAGPPITLSAGAGAFAVSGVGVSLEVFRELSAGSVSFGFTGQDATLVYDTSKTLAADAGAFSLSGQAAIYKISRVSATGSFSVSGQAANLLRASALSSEAGSFTSAGADSAGFVAHRLLAASGSFASTGNAARLLHYRLSAAATGQFALAGEAAQPRYDRALAAEGVGVTLGGSAGFLKTARRFGGHSGPFALSGYSAGLQATKIFVTLGGEITLAGEDSGALRGYVLHAGAGEFHLYEGRAYTRLVASRGQFELEGQNADLSIPVRRLSADTGAVQLQGQSVTLRRGFTVRAERGQFALTGGTSLRRIRRVSKGGRYHLTAYNAELWTGWGGDAAGSVSAEAIVFSGGFGNSTRGVGAGSIAQSGAASASILVPVATSRFSSPVAKSAVSAGRKGFKQVR